MIVANGLNKAYGKNAFLNDISVNVGAGSALAVAGGNGAGKTTLLKILATASAPDAGSLTIGGIDALKNPKRAREHIGYVPQGIALMGELSVHDNLRYWMKSADMEAYEQTLHMIGLKDVEGKKVKALSGGMQRRLNLGASLVLRPRVLILDEPLAGVDSDNRARLIRELIRIKQAGTAMVFTSHYADEMRFLADSMLVLQDGRCVYQGKPKNTAAQINAADQNKGDQDGQ